MVATFLAGIALFLSIASAQQIPQNVRAVLDHRFPGWRINQYSLPPECSHTEWATLIYKLESFFPCNLNDDKKPDYAIRFVTGKDSALFEYFVAMISNANSYDPFVLDSCRAYQGAGHRYLSLLHAGDETAIFGGDDQPELFDFAQKGKEHGAYTFPADALFVEPFCESYYKEVQISGYIFFRGRIYEFSPAD